MADKSYGQIGFEAYAEHRKGATFDNRPIPTWEGIGPDIQEAWEVAAQAIINGYDYVRTEMDKYGRDF